MDSQQQTSRNKEITVGGKHVGGSVYVMIDGQVYCHFTFWSLYLSRLKYKKSILEDRSPSQNISEHLKTAHQSCLLLWMNSSGGLLNVSDLTCLAFLHQKAGWFVVKLTEENALLCGNVGLSCKSHIKRQDFWKTKILLMHSHLMHEIHLGPSAYFMNNRETWGGLTSRTFLLIAALQDSSVLRQESLFSCRHQWKLISYDVNHY